MYNVILLKMEDCHYCDQFYPIFEKSIELNKNKNIHFEHYNIEDNELLIEKHPDIAKEKVDGYPTVLVKIGDEIKRIETVFDDDIEKASKNFLKNVNSVINETEDYYKKKYKKYKKKYIQEKNKK